MEENVLLDMLKSNTQFRELPQLEREIFAVMANEFDDNDFALYLTAKELSEKIGKGTPHQWRRFLQLEPVKAYIKQRLADSVAVAGRKALHMLDIGNLDSAGVNAAKETLKASGILNQTSQRVVVLHQVNRPRIESRKAPPVQESN